MYRDEKGWIQEYEKRGGLWIYNQATLNRHAILTSGLHSDGFFNSRKIIPDEDLLREAASDLVEKLFLQGVEPQQIDMVVGPQTGATKLAQFLSREIARLTGRHCNWASPAKLNISDLRTFVFEIKDAIALNGRDVLLCEDVVTTGGSLELVAEAVKENGGRILPRVVTLVNRSGQKEINGRPIVSLIERDFKTWTKDECPLCKIGSEAVKAKNDWERLVGKPTFEDRFREKMLDSFSGL